MAIALQVYTVVVVASLFLDVLQYASGKLLTAASVSNSNPDRHWNQAKFLLASFAVLLFLTLPTPFSKLRKSDWHFVAAVSSRCGISLSD